MLYEKVMLNTTGYKSNHNCVIYHQMGICEEEDEVNGRVTGGSIVTLLYTGKHS